jgi:nitrite reductase (cytochrome c-552)
MVNRSCQQCHLQDEKELKDRIATIQNRTFGALMRAGQTFTDFVDTMKQIRAPFDEKNRAEAETAAKTKLAADEAYAKMSNEQKTKKLSETIKAELNELWAKQVQSDPNLKEIAELHRKAQWRLDFVAAENSMGFHAPQEAIRLLSESIDYFRQAQLKTVQQLPVQTKVPVTDIQISTPKSE